MPTRLEPSEEDPWLMAVLVTCSATLTAGGIEQLLIAAA